MNDDFVFPFLPKGVEILKMLRVVRQLAEAEGSPVSVVENDDAQSAGDQIVKSANDAGRVAERELGSLFADRGNLTFIHETTIAALAR